MIVLDQKEGSSSSFEDNLRFFESNLPHAKYPYDKRNWGSPLHSLCSYQGKLKPSIAYWLVRLFSSPNMKVLDPLGGVGTVALEACLQGRIGITNDLSPFPACVAEAKITFPTADQVAFSIDKMKNHLQDIALGDDDYESARFGLNSAVQDYYHKDTLYEVLQARKYFRDLTHPSSADQFVKACLLHVLHGNRPYALSRTSHPITPFSPSGEATYKSVLNHISKRADLALKNDKSNEARIGASYYGDFRCLGEKINEPVDLIVTSPPFIGMRFDRPNWLRLWFCGWAEQDFHHRSRQFLERQQSKKDFSVYHDFFGLCKSILKPGSLMIVHLGGSTKHVMVETLSIIGKSYFDLAASVSEDVTNIEGHGIRDRGLTTSHEYLFFRNSL
jgi:hypothetical protein